MTGEYPDSHYKAGCVVNNAIVSKMEKVIHKKFLSAS